MDELLENLFKFILKYIEKNHPPISVQQQIVDNANFYYDTFIAYHLQKIVFDKSECPGLKKVIQSNDFFFQRLFHPHI